MKFRAIGLCLLRWVLKLKTPSPPPISSTGTSSISAPNVSPCLPLIGQRGRGMGVRCSVTHLKFAGSAMGFEPCGMVSRLKFSFRWQVDEFLFNVAFSNTPSNLPRRSRCGRPASMGVGTISRTALLPTRRRGTPRSEPTFREWVEPLRRDLPRSAASSRTLLLRTPASNSSAFRSLSPPIGNPHSPSLRPLLTNGLSPSETRAHLGPAH